jgi:hypothetical protein
MGARRTVLAAAVAVALSAAAASAAPHHHHHHPRPAYPATASIHRAKSFFAGRAGYRSFAVIDSRGRLRGSHVHRRFITASVVKAMLLVSYLRQLDNQHHGLSAGSRAILGPMIHLSDNNDATAVYSRVGDHGLYVVARLAKMTDFSVNGFWANAEISAADQSKFFLGMDKLIPKRFDRYARHLLRGIVGYESWGIPRAARPRGWRVYFKGGWRGTGRGQLVHQVARLERPHFRIAIAVMTDGDPSMLYGEQTIQGVAARLLQKRPRAK